MRGRYRTMIAATGAIGLVLSSCGSDDGSEATATTEAAPVATNAPDETAAPTTAAPTTAATTTAPPEEDRPLIVASTTIWADVTDNVVCGSLAQVATVVPAGTDSHQYEPSLQDRELMSSAELLVINGLALEEALLATVEAVEDEGVPVFAIADAVRDPIEFDDDGHDDDGHDDDGHDDGHDDDGHDDDGHDDDHHHDGDDPHVWFDPARIAAVLPMLGDAIVEATGLDAAAIAACVSDYQTELLATDAEMSEILDVIDDENRVLVTTHESLGYFADRFDFEILGTALPGTSSLAETNPAALEELAQAIMDAGVPAVFAEAEASSTDLGAVAERAGVEVVELRTESLGEPGSGAETYIGFLLSTATTVGTALEPS